jgi:hypothetical protein
VTPRLQRTSQQVVLTTAAQDDLMSSGELVQPPAPLPPSNGPPIYHLGSHENLAELEWEPIPFRGFNDDLQPLDSEPDQSSIANDAYEAELFDLEAWNQSYGRYN